MLNLVFLFQTFMCPTVVHIHSFPSYPCFLYLFYPIIQSVPIPLIPLFSVFILSYYTECPNTPHTLVFCILFCPFIQSVQIPLIPLFSVFILTILLYRVSPPTPTPTPTPTILLYRVSKYPSYPCFLYLFYPVIQCVQIPLIPLFSVFILSYYTECFYKDAKQLLLITSWSFRRCPDL